MLVFRFYKVTVSIERETFEECKSEIKVCAVCISLCISSFSTGQRKDSDLMTGKKQL